MHKRLRISAYLCLASSLPVFAGEIDGGSAGVKPQEATSKDAAAQDAPDAKTSDASRPAKKAPAKSKAARKKAARAVSAKKTPERDLRFDMEPGIVCKSIDGYEDYEPLPGAAQTSDEKLLVYVRPFGFQAEKNETGFQSHLTVDGEIRKRGGKAVLRQKKKLLEYKPQAPSPPQFIYMKCSISLKGLAPGEYDLVIILHDEIAKSAAATQIVKFKVIPAANPPKEDSDRSDARVLDNLYTPFLEPIGNGDDGSFERR